MSFYFDIYYWLGYGETEIIPDPKVVKQRHLLMKQIRLSKIKLKPTKTKLSYAQVLQCYNNLLEF